MTDTIEALERRATQYENVAIRLEQNGVTDDSVYRAWDNRKKAQQLREQADRLRSAHVVLGDEIGRAGR